MEAKFSKRIKEIISLSREEAIRLEHDYIGTEHLILGIFRDNDNVAVQLLEELQMPFEEVRQILERNTRNTASQSIRNLSNIPLTRQSEKILKITYLEAKALKADTVDSEHLLLSILRDNNNLAAQVMEKFDINYERVKKLLEYHADNPSARYRR